MAQFWTKAAVVNNCVLIDKLAIPEQLRSRPGANFDSTSSLASWPGGHDGGLGIYMVAISQSSDR